MQYLLVILIALAMGVAHVYLEDWAAGVVVSLALILGYTLGVGNKRLTKRKLLEQIQIDRRG